MKCVKPISFQKGRVVYKVACGQCIGCRINKSEEWSLRLKHELLSSKKAVFVTLTYRDTDYCGASLRKRDAQLFIKKLRRYYEDYLAIRYFMVGEYGGCFGRPHYLYLIQI